MLGRIVVGSNQVNLSNPIAPMTAKKKTNFKNEKKKVQAALNMNEPYNEIFTMA